MIRLNSRKVWGTGYCHDGKQYGDINWKSKMEELVKNQKYVIVQGRYGKKNLDFHYNISGIPFSRMKKEDFLKLIEKQNPDFISDVYLYDALGNERNIWQGGDEITHDCRYIYVSETASDCMMF